MSSNQFYPKALADSIHRLAYLANAPFLLPGLGLLFLFSVILFHHIQHNAQVVHWLPCVIGWRVPLPPHTVQEHTLKVKIFYLFQVFTNFKYLGSVVSDEGSEAEILSRIAQTTAALTRLKLVLNDRGISFGCLCSMVNSICSTTR